jgi:CRP/FNR family transcriptional regulator
LFGQELLTAKLQNIPLRFRPGETVYERGAPANFIYIVTKGALYRYTVLPDGRRLILQFLFPGDVFGYEQSHDTLTLSPL